MRLLIAVLLTILLSSCAKHVLITKDGTMVEGVSAETLSTNMQSRVLESWVEARWDAMSAPNLNPAQMVMMAYESRNNPLAGISLPKSTAEVVHMYYDTTLGFLSRGRWNFGNEDISKEGSAVIINDSTGVVFSGGNKNYDKGTIGTGSTYQNSDDDTHTSEVLHTSEILNWNNSPITYPTSP